MMALLPRPIEMASAGATRGACEPKTLLLIGWQLNRSQFSTALFRKRCLRQERDVQPR